MKKGQTRYAFACVERAKNLGLGYGDNLSMLMDLEYSGADCEVLLGFDNENFAHDIIGIYKNFNRETKQLEDGFCPRSSREV